MLENNVLQGKITTLLGTKKRTPEISFNSLITRGPIRCDDQVPRRIQSFIEAARKPEIHLHLFLTVVSPGQ